MIEIKQGVDLWGLSPEIWTAAVHAEIVCGMNGIRCVITSGRDGVHQKGSKHFTGQALDFRTRGLSVERVQGFAEDLRFSLGADYDVVVESNHLHVEHDPKGKG